MANPDQACATILSGLGLTLGSSLFLGPVRPPSTGVAHQAAFCLETGGPGPLRHHRNDANRLVRAGVQVRVRSNVDDFAGGEALARQAWELLDDALPTGYLSFVCRESAPVYLGKDANEHHEWSINVETLRNLDIGN